MKTKDSILLQTIAGEKHDRPPIWLMRQAGRVLPSYMALREKYTFKELMANPKLASEVTLLPVADLGVDAAILFSDILVIPEAMGLKLEFKSTGPVFENLIPDLTDPTKHLDIDLNRLNYIYENIKQIITDKPADIPLIGFCGGPLTVMCYMIDGSSKNHIFPETVKFLYKYPKAAQKLIDVITEVTINYVKSQLVAGIDVFQLFETHAGLIPFQLYEKLFLPAVRKIISAVRGEIPTIYFPKGIGTGLTALTPDISDIVGVDWQTSLFQADELLNPEFGIQGNIDPRLLYGNQNIIDSELIELQRFFEKDRRWILNFGHGFLPDIPFDNAKYLVSKAKSMSWN